MPVQKTYTVCISVRRSEFYSIQAANEQDALACAFEDGDFLESGETFDVEEISAKETPLEEIGA